ncbi:MAG TPA: GNAT family N-acetyltransferase [Anaerolineales bacterium]
MSSDTRWQLRQATEQDFPAIKRLIRRVRINPWSLDWRRFVVAVDGDDQLVGCGQLKPHGRSVIELASIAVEETHRGQGIARLIIETLLARAPRPVYLTARSGLRSLYSKWGFEEVKPEDMPAYYLRLSRAMSLLQPFFGDGEYLLVMVLK